VPIHVSSATIRLLNADWVRWRLRAEREKLFVSERERKSSNHFASIFITFIGSIDNRHPSDTGDSLAYRLALPAYRCFFSMGVSRNMHERCRHKLGYIPFDCLPMYYAVLTRGSADMINAR
jgi:hypothetical protein